MKKFNKLSYIFTSSLISAMLLSCNIGLGPAVDLVAPTLTMISPENNSTVPQTVTVSGTAADDEGINTLTVSIEETSQVYRWSNNSWQVSVNGEWQTYAAGTYTGDAKSLTWSVDVPITGAVSAQTFTLVTKATDAMGNEGKASKDERYITVDISEPQVSINYPVITKEYTSAKAKFDSYTLCDNNVLQNLVNQDIEISGYQKEDLVLDSLYIYIDEETSASVPAAGTEITNYIIKRQVTGDSLRNWSETITESDIDDSYKTGKHLFRLITESHDSAGNVERKVQGWFTYWNEADAPWVTGDFGYGEGETIEKSVYPSCDLQGYSYDDDGLKSIEIKVYKLNESVTPNVYEEVTEKSTTINLDSENNPTFYNWKVTALAEACTFKVIAKCTDVNGLESASQIERFMKVSDVNPPQITVTNSNENSLFGNSNGDFTITGYVIDDDKDHKPSLVLVWIKDDTNLSKYVNTDYDGWKNDISSTTGDKRFVISLDDASTEKTQYYDDFSKTLNLFNDLGIGINGNPLNTLNFALLATDNGGETSTNFVSFAGDFEKPALTIDKVTVDSTSYNFEDSNREGNLLLPPFTRNADGTIASTVKLSGTWSDDSTDVWNKNTAKIGKVQISWTNYSGTIDVTMKSDGTWSTAAITPPDSSTASISASLTDIGGNTATTNECFNINISQPELTRLSATTTDGSYSVGKIIYLTMEFNKAVTYEGGSRAPQLQLSLGDTVYASYSSGNGSATHIFKYEVVSGDNISPLDVTSIITNGNKWYDSNGTEVTNIAIPTVTANKLSGNRNIILNTTAPSISSITAITSNGYYGAGTDLYFALTFSEDVTITDVSQIKLKFAGDIESDSVQKSGPANLLFKYTVTDGKNTSPLTLQTVDFGSCSVTDTASNSLTLTNDNYTVSANPCAGIYVDTTTPETPVISFTTTGVTGSSETVYEDSVLFTITGFESDSGTKKKYSTDGGKTYSDYSGAVTISTNGTYEITAYQEDAAGNKSDNAAKKTFTLDSGKILTSVTSSLPNGTYTTGKEIDFVLTFRKAVNASETSLVLVDSANESNTKFASEPAAYSSISSDKKTVTYKYTVIDGDTCSTLNVKSISGTLKDSAGAVIDSSYYAMPSGSSFTDNRSSISIMTGKPSVQSFRFNGTDTITITYDRNINKGDGEIIIEQNSSKSSYLVPAVLTESEYAAVSGISSYYTKGTNGSDEDGDSDTSTKYVLNYSYDTDKDTIVDLFEKAGSFKISVDAGSKCVSVSGKTLTITLTSTAGKVLPVKGVYYNVTIPESFVSDDLDNVSDEYTSELFTKGVETPFVRVNKTSGGVSAASTTSQPLTASAKIDCRTPGATISYQLKTNEYSPDLFVKDRQISKTEKFSGSSFGTSVTASTISLGKDVSFDKGYSALIKATASVDTTANPSSSVNYETAYRTVILLQNGYDTDSVSKTSYSQPWVRGGDAVNGGVITPGFPLSFDSTEFTKVKAMSHAPSSVSATYSDETETISTSDWYWISWEINTAAYPHFLYGDLPTLESDISNGPTKWAWTCQGFVSYKSYYPLYPGQSILFQTGDSGYGSSPGTSSSNQRLTCYKKHCEYRSGTSVIKSMKSE